MGMTAGKNQLVEDSGNDSKMTTLDEKSSNQENEMIKIEDFTSNFSSEQIEEQGIISLVTNFNLIYMTLLGLTDIFIKNDVISNI